MDQYQQTCTSCSFWDQADRDVPIGRCRRYAPRPHLEVLTQLEDYTDGAVWPYTEETEWCGEHRLFSRASNVTMAS